MATKASVATSQERLQRSILEVQTLLESYRRVETLTHKQAGRHQDLVEDLVRRQTLVEMGRRLRSLHAAELAHVLGSLPLADKLLLWKQLDPKHGAAVLLESSSALRETLLAELDRPSLLLLLSQMDADDLATLAGEVPSDVVREVALTLDAQAPRALATWSSKSWR